MGPAVKINMRLPGYLLDTLVLLCMCGLLLYGASWQFHEDNSDVGKYQCYATQFWSGQVALGSFPIEQCDFILAPDPNMVVISQDALVAFLKGHGVPASIVHFVVAQSAGQPYEGQPFHSLPYEYPLLTLIPLSLALLAPANLYQIAFALWMLLIAVIVYLALLRWRSRQAAMLYACILTAAGWSTLAARFDIVPSALTLFAILCAVHKRWHSSYILLALATLFKFYPAVLLVPFLITHQRAVHGKWYVWRRWSPLAAYVLVCALVMTLSLLLNVEGTIAPFSYFGYRPVQVESFAAILLWLWSLVGHLPLHYALTYGSLNVYSPGSAFVSTLDLILLAAGLLTTFWLQWRGKVPLVTSCLLTLLIVMITGKVFSPQYLIWVVPLVAYAGVTDALWGLCWLVIGLLTTWIYPYIYLLVRIFDVPYQAPFYPLATARNLLLLGFVVSVLLYCARQRPVERSVPRGEAQQAGEQLPLAVAQGEYQQEGVIREQK